MEIAPIAGVRVLPVNRVRPVDPELAPFFDIEAAVRLDEDTYAPNSRKAAGAEESEDEFDEPEAAVEEDSGWIPATRYPANRRRGQLSIFA